MIGAYNPLPKRIGGGPSVLEALHNDLLESYGSGFDKSRGGYLWGLTYADARGLWAMWCRNESLLAQRNPATATWSLPAWEKDYGLSAYGLNLAQRRAQLVALIARQGLPTSYQDINAALRQAMGDTFVELRFLTPYQANIHMPSGGYPPGITWTVDPDFPWMSTVAYVAVKVRDVPGVPSGEFYERVGRMYGVLNARLNVWATFDWFKVDGFVLDQPNLDVAAFNV